MIGIPLCSIAWPSKATWHSIVVSKQTLPDRTTLVAFVNGEASPA